MIIYWLKFEVVGEPALDFGLETVSIILGPWPRAPSAPASYAYPPFL